MGHPPPPQQKNIIGKNFETTFHAIFSPRKKSFGLINVYLTKNVRKNVLTFLFKWNSFGKLSQPKKCRFFSNFVF